MRQPPTSLCTTSNFLMVAMVMVVMVIMVDRTGQDRTGQAFKLDFPGNL